MCSMFVVSAVCGLCVACVLFLQLFLLAYFFSFNVCVVVGMFVCVLLLLVLCAITSFVCLFWFIVFVLVGFLLVCVLCVGFVLAGFVCECFGLLAV